MSTIGQDHVPAIWNPSILHMSIGCQERGGIIFGVHTAVFVQPLRLEHMAGGIIVYFMEKKEYIHAHFLRTVGRLGVEKLLQQLNRRILFSPNSRS